MFNNEIYAMLKILCHCEGTFALSIASPSEADVAGGASEEQECLRNGMSLLSFFAQITQSQYL